jgi:hypothetical protein
MKKAIKDTRRGKKDITFNLYDESGDLIERDYAVTNQGSPTPIIMQEGCIGNFHTHFTSVSKMSPIDAFFACRINMMIIGGIRDNKIICYMIRDGERDLCEKELKPLVIDFQQIVSEQRNGKNTIDRGLKNDKDTQKVVSKFFDVVGIA